MKKAAIITIFDMNNYGNRLQNYAVQEILKKKGLEPQTLKNVNIYNGKNSLEQTITQMTEKRYENFLEFNKNINVTEETFFHSDDNSKLNDRYDYFIIGSDQIWNYDFENRFSDFSFASFADKKKRIALSASFGVSSVPENIKFKYKELKNLKAISVREFQGKDIVKDITGEDRAKVLIDPTMVLSAQEWEKVMIKPENFPEKKYILKYFLGKLSKEKEDEINRIADENKWDIVDVMEKNGFGDMGPAQFIYLFRHSSYVVTDSFHACVFSILFNKPFLYFDRDSVDVLNMNSRLITLFEKFELNNRIFNGKITNDLLSIDYTNTYKILENEIKKYDEFLTEALL